MQLATYTDDGGSGIQHVFDMFFFHEKDKQCNVHHFIVLFTQCSYIRNETVITEINFVTICNQGTRTEWVIHQSYVSNDWQHYVIAMKTYCFGNWYIVKKALFRVEMKTAIGSS